MSLVRCDQISIEFGDNPLLTETDLTIENKERIALIGRNGAGKSTLLKIISGRITADRGEITYKRGLRISKLDQQLLDDLDKTTFEIVKDGLVHQQELIDQYQLLSSGSPDRNQLNEMELIQADIEAGGGWHPDKQVERIITQLDLPKNSRLEDLSGGWRRRVALGKALVSNPELLLLDEPTNHLDIATIEWLENRIRSYPGAVVFITHDRNFLSKLCTRIVEIDRGKLVSWPGNYKKYLELKEQADQEEDVANALFDKRLAEEESWIRQGIKARRTRNEGRVRALHQLRKESEQRIKRQGKAKVQIETAESAGRRIIDARSITHGYGDNTLIKDFRLKIMRGDRIGLIGNNGVGKSTLLKILLGQITPDKGSIKTGNHLEIGYFDQVRRELQPEKTVAENVGNGKEYIKLGGKDRHVVGYLRNFLFSAKRAMTPVKYLSGGECNRVLLAKLFTQANNLLILDEPTNDLDVEMLEALEEQLVEYQGTLIIVSHDRTFLDNVVSSVLVFEEEGNVVQYAGGYSDWARRGHKLLETEKPIQSETKKQQEPKSTPAKKSSTNKLSYKYKRELEMLPEQIETLEKEISELSKQTLDPDFYNQEFETRQPILDRLADLQSELNQKEERWIYLEEMKGS
ncbi:MAG: ATP-binding cassette domain-containing protein [Porticoccaceae bacterium]|nr:ATP-binding cassette domain-containing protein [Porticoccaceae bacterium]